MGLPVMSMTRAAPGFSMPGSPRNLFMTKPPTMFWWRRASSDMVPTICAKQPPRSMSAAIRTGAEAASAMSMLAMSNGTLISAGEPAPSSTTTWCLWRSSARDSSATPTPLALAYA